MKDVAYAKQSFNDSLLLGDNLQPTLQPAKMEATEAIYRLTTSISVKLKVGLLSSC